MHISNAVPCEESLDGMLGDLSMRPTGAPDTERVTPVSHRPSTDGGASGNPFGNPLRRSSTGSLGDMGTRRKSIEKQHSWTTKKETTPPALGAKFAAFAARLCRQGSAGLVSLRDPPARVLRNEPCTWQSIMAEQQGELDRLLLQQQVISTELAALRFSFSSDSHAEASESSM